MGKLRQIRYLNQSIEMFYGSNSFKIESNWDNRVVENNSKHGIVVLCFIGLFRYLQQSKTVITIP